MKQILLACLVVASLSPQVALAAPADRAIESARRSFEQGTQAFNRGDFAGAAQAYEAANKAKPDPFFLYNIAQAYRLAKEPTKALNFYREYLRADPTAANRKEVEARIARLEAELAAAQPAPPPPPAPVATTPAPTTAGLDLSTSHQPAEKPVYKKGWFWGVIVGVVVVAGVGVGLGVGLTRGGPSAPASELGNQKVFLLGGAQ